MAGTGRVVFDILDESGSPASSFGESDIVGFRLSERISGLRPTLDPLARNTTTLRSHPEAPDRPFPTEASGDIPATLGLSPGCAPPYALHLRAYAGPLEGAADSHLHHRARLRLGSPEGGFRYIHGHIFREFFVAGATEPETVAEYHVYPWLWYLAFSRRSRLWKGTTPDILKQLVGDYDGGPFAPPDIDFSKIDGTPDRPIVTQWLESDYAFFNRMLERDGLFYYFLHEESDTKLVVGGKTDDFQSGELHEKHTLHLKRQAADSASTMSDRISALAFGEQAVPQQMHARDYNPLNATAKLDAHNPSEDKPLRVFDYPAGFDRLDAGMDVLAPRGMRQMRSLASLATAWGTSPYVEAGGFVSIKIGPEFRLGGDRSRDEYLVRQVVHEFWRDRETREAQYANVFEVMPSNAPYSPAALHPRPQAPGPMLAVITGNDEIDVNKDGFAPIAFKWDADEVTVRARLVQGWAGGDHGWHILPRQGDEVIVSFADGDMERPVIVGSLYNSDRHMLFDPTRDVGLSDVTASKGAGRHVTALADKGNRVMLFDDEGAERLALVAARNRDDLTVDKHVSAAGHRVAVVRHNQFEEIHGNYNLYVGSSMNIDIVGDVNLRVGGNINVNYMGEGGPDALRRKS